MGFAGLAVGAALVSREHFSALNLSSSVKSQCVCGMISIKSEICNIVFRKKLCTANITII